MKKLILVAGATGNLGQKICRELIKLKVSVRAVVREGSDAKKIAVLEDMGVDISVVDLSDEAQLTEIFNGVSCVVSALAGLHDVIVGTQTSILNAAIAAGVPRFIPSDFSTDFTDIPFGENRNFDLRKEFHQILENAPVKATSIYNGAFADILRYNIPLFNVKNKTIAYYEGKVDWKIDFTTMDDTAAFTAQAALDEDAPRALHIASFSVSPQDLVDLASEYKGSDFELVNMGALDGLSAYNNQQRTAQPDGENQLYPKWQQSQYLYSMFLIHHESIDNDRYEGLSWSPVEGNI